MYEHHAAVTSVAVSVDGRWSAAGSEDGTGSVWDSRTRRHSTLQHWQRTVHDVLFWEERRALVTASAAGDVRLWSLSGGDDPELRLNGSGSSIVTKLAMSEDRRTIASLSFATAVHVWNTATNTEVTSVHRAPTLVAMALSGDGTRVLTAGHDQQARLWDARTGNQLVSWKVQGHPTAVALSRFADTAVVATSTGAQVWRLGKPSRMAAFRHPTDVTRVALSGDGKVLAALSGGKVWVWNISSRRPIATVDHSSGMSDVALDGTGSAVAIAGESGVGAAYSVTDRRKLCELRTSEVQSAAAISSDGGTAVVGSWDGSLVWCNVSTGLESGRSSGTSPVKSVVIVQSDGMLTTVVGRGDGSIESCHQGGPCEVIARQDAPIRRLAAAAAAKLIASSAPDARLRLWDWPRRRLRFDVPLLAFGTDLAASATTVVAATERGVQMFDSESGRETWRVERLGSVSSVALSTAADRVVMAVGDQVLVVGTDTSELIAQACQHLSPVLSPEEWQKLLPGVRYRRGCPEVP
jgi:WD40 repeat protein